jgi:HAE1 family hydrophobic/amphiphilic exporter-1
VNSADQPILILTFSSPTLPLSVVDAYAENIGRSESQRGTALLKLLPMGRSNMRAATTGPSVLAARNPSIDEVADALKGHNSNLPTVTLWGSNWAYTVQANGQLNDAGAYRQIIISANGNGSCSIGGAQRVIDGVHNDKTAAWFNQRHSIIRISTRTC